MMASHPCEESYTVTDMDGVSVNSLYYRAKVATGTYNTHAT